LVTESHSILARWRKNFSQLLNVHEVNDVRQTEIYTTEPLVPEPSAFEFELAIEKLRRHKSPDIYQIPTKQRVGQFALRSINLLFQLAIRRNCLRSGRNRLLYLSIERAIKQIVVFIGAYHFCQLRTIFYSTSCCLSQFHMQRKFLGIINVDLDAAGQLLIIISAFVKNLRKNGNIMKQYISS